MTIKCFDNIIMLRFGKTEEFYGAKKKTITIWDVSVNDIII